MILRRFLIALSGAIGACLTTAAAAGQWQTVPVQESRVDSRVVLGGTVVPTRQVTIAAQLPGRVEFIAGAEGDTFKQDTVLVSLNDDELMAQRRAALAQMGNADAAMRNAGVQYTRELVNPWSNNQMPGMGVPSMFDSFFTRGMQDFMGTNNSNMDRHADLVARGAGVEQARSAFFQAQSQLDAIDAKLKDTKGYAPFDGVVTDKLVEVGDTVQPGQPLLKYADINFLQIQVEVPSRLMLALREGMTVPARLDLRNTMVQARVARIFPMADAKRHTVTVKFDLPTESPAAAGMYAEVSVLDPNVSTQSLPVVPLSSLVRRGSLPAVYIERDDGETEMRLVRLGEQVGMGYISILSGIRTGERVIANPTPGMTSSASRAK